MIKKAQKEDLEKILELQYLSYRSEAKLFGNMDIPPLKQTVEEVYDDKQAMRAFQQIPQIVLSGSKSISADSTQSAVLYHGIQ